MALGEGEAAAIETLQEMKANFMQMTDAANEVVAYREAVDNLKLAKGDLEEAQKDLSEAKLDQSTAQQDTLAAGLALKKGQEAVAAAEKKITKAKQALITQQQLTQQYQQEEMTFAPAVQSAQEAVDALAEKESVLENQREAALAQLEKQGEANRAAAVEKALQEINYTQDRLGEVEDKFAVLEAHSDMHQETVDADYQNQLDEVDASAEDAQNQLDAAVEHLEALTDARIESQAKTEEAKQILVDVQTEYSEAKDDLKESQKDFIESKNSVSEAAVNLQAAKENLVIADTEAVQAKKTIDEWGQTRFWQGGMEYYSWKGAGSSGHQIYTPYEYSTTQKNTDFTLTAGYISSDTGLQNGSVSGWTDTTIEVGESNKNKVYDIRYSLLVNVPTGISKIYDNAVVMEDLAAYSRFSEGWNWTPMITVKKKLNATDSWSWGSLYSFRSSYEYSKDLPGSEISPGNAWGQTIEYMHAGNKDRFLASLEYTGYGATKEDNVSYTEGNQLGLGLCYEKIISPKNSWQLYYKYLKDDKINYAVIDPDTPNDVVKRHYYGIGYTHKVRTDQTLQVMFNFMTSKGNAYNPLLRQNADGRKRKGLELKYDIQMSEESSLAFGIERYFLDDNSTGEYQGTNITLVFAKNL